MQHFSSDRSHMLHPNGDWISPPPPYECIHSEGENIFSETYCSYGSMCSSNLLCIQVMVNVENAIV